MLSTAVVHRCPHCAGERLQKNGHAEHGAQRAKCVDCQRTFVLSPRGPRYDEQFKAQVLAAYQDRMGIRGITRTFGVYYQTITAWVVCHLNEGHAAFVVLERARAFMQESGQSFGGRWPQHAQATFSYQRSCKTDPVALVES